MPWDGLASRRVPLWRRASWALEYAAVRGAMLLVQLFSPEAGERVARFLGRAYFRLDGARRHAALENLRVAFGDGLDDEGRRRLARRSFEHAFVLLFEVVTRGRLVPHGRAFWRRARVLGDVAEARKAQRDRRGGFLLTAHLGNWETAGAYLAYEGVPFSAVARSVPNPYVQRLLTGTRRQTFEVFEKLGAVRDSVRAIREGRWVAILSDQNAGRHGVFVPFFGVPASTYPLAATLAVRHGFPVFFGVAIRRGPFFAYDFHVHAYHPPAGLPHKEAAAHVLREYHAWLESMIRLAPEQYLWMHRRWKTRPAGEVPGPHLPAYRHRGRRARPAWAPAKPGPR